MPVDKVKARVYREDMNGDLHEVLGNDRKPLLFHISHFRTCPHATEHSKEGGGASRLDILEAVAREAAKLWKAIDDEVDVIDSPSSDSGVRPNDAMRFSMASELDHYLGKLAKLEAGSMIGKKDPSWRPWNGDRPIWFFSTAVLSGVGLWFLLYLALLIFGGGS